MAEGWKAAGSGGPARGEKRRAVLPDPSPPGLPISKHNQLSVPTEGTERARCAPFAMLVLHPSGADCRTQQNAMLPHHAAISNVIHFSWRLDGRDTQNKSQQHTGDSRPTDPPTNTKWAGRRTVKGASEQSQRSSSSTLGGSGHSLTLTIEILWLVPAAEK